MRFLMGTTAYNMHVQQMAQALYEAEVLGAFYTGMADNYRSALCSGLRKLIEKRLPGLDAQLRRRRVSVLPDKLIYKDWGWDLLRIMADKANMGTLTLDWIWRRSQHRLDKKCAHLIKDARFDGFFGIEYGSLSAIEAAKKEGKKSIVAFLSPHHSMRKEWVDKEYEKFPGLRTPVISRLMESGKVRDARRDKEADLADVVCTNSKLVRQSLVRAGIPEDKIITVPLGSPEAISSELLPRSLPAPFSFMYAGPVSAQKGVHYLLEAWKRFEGSSTAQLHLYGIPLLPKKCFAGLGKNIILHGSVAKQQLYKAYQRAGVLVFPSLCDGFGMVVTEAFAHGLPVITTKNAGVSDFIEEGKNGFLVAPGDSKGLAERMQWCLCHQSELLRMRRHALDTARSYSWGDFRNKLKEELKTKGFV